MTMVGNRTVVAAALLAGTFLTGCSSWKALRVPPTQYLAEKPGATLRLTDRGSTRTILHDAHVTGDSLLGVSRDVRGHHPVAVPLDSIAKSEGHEFSVIRTGALVVGVGAPALFVIVVVAWARAMSEH